MKKNRSHRDTKFRRRVRVQFCSDGSTLLCCSAVGALLLCWFNMIICRGHFHLTSIRHLHREENLDSQLIQIQKQIQMLLKPKRK